MHTSSFAFQSGTKIHRQVGIIIAEVITYFQFVPFVYLYLNLVLANTTLTELPCSCWLEAFQ